MSKVKIATGVGILALALGGCADSFVPGGVGGMSEFQEDVAQGYCEQLADIAGSLRQAVAKQLVEQGMESQSAEIKRSHEICPELWK